MTDHIKVPDVVPIVRVLADGARTEFEYPFPIFASEDLSVYLNGALQVAEFDIIGAGVSGGGSVVFDTAPADGAIVTLERRMKFERLTDFIEGGDFAASSINTELDYLVAGLQQVTRDQSAMLKYPTTENPSVTTLPDRMLRANKALGFDGEGNPIAVSLEGSITPPDYTAVGTGAVTRTNHDKLSESISVKDFGAVGDGLTDDTQAFQKALGAVAQVFVPSGTYIITSTIEIGSSQILYGAGDASLIQTSLPITLLQMTGSYAQLKNLKLFGGAVGLKLFGGGTGPCVNNAITDVSIWQAQTGILLDGYTDGNKPTYWNNFTRVLVAQPFVHGIHLMRSGAGDTPNANRFHQCRVYSLGATTSGSGLYVEEGSFNNSFVDFEVNVAGTAQACVRVGSGSNKTLFVNLYTESNNGVPNVKLDAGSIETSIYNLLSASDGSSIWDLSGGEYSAYNAGYPYKNRFQNTFVKDLTVKAQRFETQYTDTSGTIQLSPAVSVQLLSSYNGALTAKLPKASDATGVLMTIKKIDSSKNVITITEDNGLGADNTDYYLGSENDYMQVLSNGAEWFVIASNRSAGNTRFFDGSGTYDIDLAVDVYLLSSFSGSLTARLPPADAVKAIGRTVTIKKTDVSNHTVLVAVQGGGGLDGYTQTLAAQYQAITAVSDGAHWYITSRFS